MAAPSLCFDDVLLRDVSRSFYLTMRWLPQPMRPAVAVGYLLARATDSVADTSTAPTEQRRAVLGLMRAAVTGRADADELERLFMQLRGALAQAQPNPAEYRLLRRFGDCLEALGNLPEQERVLVCEVLDTITAGQTEDLDAPLYTEESDTLRYADAVAGCVGVFWTRLGYAAMGENFAAPAAQELMEQAGLRYGRGLQLINMLRDEEEDAAIWRGTTACSGAIARSATCTTAWITPAVCRRGSSALLPCYPPCWGFKPCAFCAAARERNASKSPAPPCIGRCCMPRGKRPDNRHVARSSLIQPFSEK